MNNGVIVQWQSSSADSVLLVITPMDVNASNRSYSSVTLYSDSSISLWVDNDGELQFNPEEIEQFYRFDLLSIRLNNITTKLVHLPEDSLTVAAIVVLQDEVDVTLQN